MNSLLDDLNDLRLRAEGWNGYDALPPHPLAIDAAKDWLRTWLGDLDEPDLDDRPRVTASADGEVVLEWWRNCGKSLTVYVNPITREGRWNLSFVQSWGPDIDTEMSDGQIYSEGDWAALWKWLVS